MSTLKTHNLQSPDAGSVNIALASNAGMVVAGISTFNNNVNVSGTIETTGSELKITGAEPRLTFTDTDNNPDFQIWANAQKFAIYDSTNSATRVHINSSGRIGIGTETPDTLVEIGNAIGPGTANLLKLTSYTNSQSSRPALVFWNNNPNTAQAQISAKGGASYNASKLHFSVANTSRSLVDRVCIDEYGTLIVGGGESRRNTKGSNQHQVLLIEGTGNNSTRMSMIRSSNDDNGPEIQLIKTRGTSIGSVTKPNQNDYIGALTFMAGDDTDLYARGADIAVVATGTPANDRVPCDILFSTTPTSGATSPQLRLRITSGGGLKFISADSPTSTTEPAQWLNHSGGMQLYASSGTSTHRNIIFCSASNAASERLRITNTGQLVVGTNPSVSSGNIVHIEAPTSFNSGETIVNIEGDNATAGPRLLLHNNNTGASAHGEILGVDAGGQSTSSIRFYNTDQSNNYGEIAFGTRNQSGVPPEDRMRITKDGKVVAGGTGAGYPSRLQSHGAGDLLDLNSTSGAGKIRFYESGAGRFNIETLNGTAGLRFYDSLNAVERMRIHDDGGIQISTVRNVSAVASNTTGSFTSAELILTTPIYAEYHYTWSGQSNYTIDLTCASYFHSEFIYVQHQTNGGTGMQSYIRGKWANNHQTHTCQIHEWYGVTMGLDVTFVASDQSGNGAVNGEHGLTAAGWSNANYRGLYGGGGDNYDNTSSANGRLRITETYQGWGSVSTRGLIVRVYFGSFAISKS